MKLLSLTKFQLKNTLPLIAAFFLLTLGNLFYATMCNRPMMLTQSMGNTAVVAFFLGLFPFYRAFRLSQAMGVSRRKLFASNCLALFLLSVFIVLTAAAMAFATISLYNVIPQLMGNARVWGFADFAPYLKEELLITAPWLMLIGMITALAGYLISVLFYRWRGVRRFPLNKWIAGPLMLALCLFSLPWFFNTGNVVTYLIAPSNSFVLKFATLISLLVLLGAASWLVVQRITVNAPDAGDISINQPQITKIPPNPGETEC